MQLVWKPASLLNHHPDSYGAAQLSFADPWSGIENLYPLCFEKAIPSLGESKKKSWTLFPCVFSRPEFHEEQILNQPAEKGVLYGGQMLIWTFWKWHIKLIVGSYWTKSQSRQIHTMLGFQDTGQFVKGQCTFVQGSNSSDLNENGLKMLHVGSGFALFTHDILIPHEILV